MEKNNAKLNRNAIRWLVAAAALGCVQVNAADSRFDAFMGRVVGNNTTVTFGTGGTPIATSSAGLGTPNIGNMAAVANGKSVDIVGNVKAPLGNTAKAVGAIARSPIARGAFVRGIAGVLTGPVGGAALVAAPYVIDWLSKGGYSPNPNVKNDPDHPFLKTVRGDGWDYTFDENKVGWSTSVSGACSKYLDYLNPLLSGYNLTYISSSSTLIQCEVLDSSTGRKSNIGGSKRKAQEWFDQYPASLADVVMYMDTPEAPSLTPAIVEQAVVKAGIDPFGAQQPEVKVSGPSSVPGAQTSSSTTVKVIPNTTTEAPQGYTGETQPGTRTRTETQSHGVTYNNNVVTYNTNTITNTTITNNITGNQSTTTETAKADNDSDAEDKPDTCEKNPEALMCQKPELDLPSGDIPKTSKTISYQEEDTFGGGACPANVFASIGGKNTMVYDWGQTCGTVSTYLRPIILLLGAMGALFILIPGRDA